MTAIYKGSEAIQLSTSMQKIKVDAENWTVFYYDKGSNAFWALDYPESELQGGGSPRLSKLNRVSEELINLIEKLP